MNSSRDSFRTSAHIRAAKRRDPQSRLKSIRMRASRSWAKIATTHGTWTVWQFRFDDERPDWRSSRCFHATNRFSRLLPGLFLCLHLYYIILIMRFKISLLAGSETKISHVNRWFPASVHMTPTINTAPDRTSPTKHGPSWVCYAISKAFRLVLKPDRSSSSSNPMIHTRDPRHSATRL